MTQKLATKCHSTALCRTALTDIKGSEMANVYEKINGQIYVKKKWSETNIWYSIKRQTLENMILTWDSFSTHWMHIFMDANFSHKFYLDSDESEKYIAINWNGNHLQVRYKSARQINNTDKT